MDLLRKKQKFEQQCTESFPVSAVIKSVTERLQPFASYTHESDLVLLLLAGDFRGNPARTLKDRK
jgi:hypothetical protein